MRSGGGRPTAAVANIIYGRIGRFRMRNLVGIYPGSASHNCASRIMLSHYWPPVCAGTSYPNSSTSMRRHPRVWPTSTYGLRCQECEAYVSALIEQVSGLEKIRSTPLPIAYVTHLRTFLFAYCILLPYIWVSEWSWLTIPLVGFTFFAVRPIQSITITGEYLS